MGGWVGGWVGGKLCMGPQGGCARCRLQAPDAPCHCPRPAAPQFWPLVAHKVVGCQFIMVVFTASVLLFKVGSSHAHLLNKLSNHSSNHSSTAAQHSSAQPSPR